MATFAEFLQAELQREAQQKQLGPQDVQPGAPTPQQGAPLVPAQALAAAEQPSLGGVVPPSEETPSVELIRGKFLRGEPLTPGERTFFEQQVSKPGGLVNVAADESQLQALGQSVGPAVIEGVGGAVGAGVGSLLAPGAGTIAGGAIGSGLGTAASQALGLEEKNALNILASSALGGVAGGIGRGAKKGASLFGAGAKIERAEESIRLGQQLRGSIKSPTTDQVNVAFDAVRQSPATLDATGFAQTFNNVVEPKIAKQIIKDVGKVKSNLGTKLEDVLSGQAATLNGEEVLDLRKALNSAKDAQFKKKGLGKVASDARAKELEEITDKLDEGLETAARSGNPTAILLNDANQKFQVKLASDNLSKLVNSKIGTEIFRSGSRPTLNIKSLLNDVEKAKDATRAGVPNNLTGMIKQIQKNEGSLTSFEKTLRDMSKLQAKIPIVDEVGGVLGTTAKLAQRNSISEAVTEILLNPQSRTLFQKAVASGTAGLTTGSLAALLAHARVSSGNIDEFSGEVLRQIASTGRVPQLTPQEIPQENVTFGTTPPTRQQTPQFQVVGQ